MGLFQVEEEMVVYSAISISLQDIVTGSQLYHITLIPLPFLQLHHLLHPTSPLSLCIL